MKNVLIQYKGGGYDGCFWEWNYGFFNPIEIFESMYHSGREGCDTQEKIYTYMENAEEGSDYFLIDMTNAIAIAEFVIESNAGHIISASKWFEEFKEDTFPDVLPIMMKCVDCDQEYEAYELTPCDHEGAGGIAIQATAGICADCEYERYYEEETE